MSGAAQLVFDGFVAGVFATFLGSTIALVSLVKISDRLAARARRRAEGAHR